MWPLMLGTVKTSPRTELCLHAVGGSGAIIKVVNGTTYKLLRGDQGAAASSVSVCVVYMPCWTYLTLFLLRYL